MPDKSYRTQKFALKAHKECVCAVQAVLLVGDLTYSDSYHTNGILRHPDPPTTPYQETYQPRWDAWGRMMAPLASQASQ